MATKKTKSRPIIEAAVPSVSLNNVAITVDVKMPEETTQIVLEITKAVSQGFEVLDKLAKGCMVRPEVGPVIQITQASKEEG